MTKFIRIATEGYAITADVIRAYHVKSYQATAASAARLERFVDNSNPSDVAVVIEHDRIVLEIMPPGRALNLLEQNDD